MNNRQEQELDAAEYVIGTLSVVERRAFEDLMALDAQTRDDVWYWERAFGALNVSISPEAPPANMWERIYYSLPEVVEQQKRRAERPAAKKLVAHKSVVKKAKAQAKREKKSAKESAKAAKIEQETQKQIEREAQKKVEQEAQKIVEREAQKKVDRKTQKTPDVAVSGSNKPNPNKYVSHWWRKLAKLACIIALCLAAYTVFKPTEFVKVTAEGKTEKPAINQYFAVVNADWNLPSLVVRVNSVTGAMKIDGTGIVSPEGKSLHIWHRSAKNGRKSIGLLGDDPENFRLVAAKLGDVLEISIEPAGGAPDGKPNGPIVYSGKLAAFKP